MEPISPIESVHRRFLARGAAIVMGGLAAIGIGAFSHSPGAEAGVSEHQGTATLPIDGAVQGDLTVVDIVIPNSITPGYVSLVSSDHKGYLDTSSHNQFPGVIAANTAAAEVGADGSVVLQNSSHGPIKTAIDHLVTLKGDVAHGANGRLLDTRTTGSQMATGQILSIPTPAEDGDGVMLNITTINHIGSGYITAFPCDSPVPLASSANYVINTIPTKPNMTIAEAGSNDNAEVCFYNGGAPVDLIVDITGVLEKDTAFSAPLRGAPERLVDTRIGLGGDRLQPNEEIVMSYPGAGPGDVAWVNLTPVRASAPGFGLVHSSDGLPSTPVSNVNYPDGRTGAVFPNLAPVQVGADGTFVYRNSEHASVDIAIDILGITPSSAVRSATPYRILDNRENGTVIEPSKESFHRGYTEIPYDASKELASDANKNIVKVQTVTYGPENRVFDVYESANPVNAAKTDAVMIRIHGGGYVSGNKELTSGYDDLGMHLSAEYGYTLISPNITLSFPEAAQDIIATVKTAREMYPNSKIILYGWSAGGNLGTLAGFGNEDPQLQPTYLTPSRQSQSGRPDAIINLAGPLNPAAWAAQPLPGVTPPNNGLNQFLRIASYSQDTAQYEPLNVLHYATMNNPALFDAMSHEDPIIPYATQTPTRMQLAQFGPVVHNVGGPSTHIAGNDVNVPLLLTFLQLVLDDDSQS